MTPGTSAAPGVPSGRVLVTGATGQARSGLLAALQGRFQVTGIGFRQGRGPDLRDEAALAQWAGGWTPEAVVHAAGLKDVRACEERPDLAWEANVLPVLNLARTFPAARIILLSSDHVFPGTGGGYREEDAPCPANAYGRSKLAAEEALAQLGGRGVVLRFAALVDPQAAFVRFLEGELSAGRPVEAFQDAHYTPTWHGDLAAWVAGLLAPEPPGAPVFHVCGARVSRYEFASLFAQARGHDASLVRPVHRPAAGGVLADSSLDCTASCRRLRLEPTPHREALALLSRRMEAQRSV